MISEKITYVASDGKIFSTKAEAEKYEDTLTCKEDKLSNLNKAYKDLLTISKDFYNDYPNFYLTIVNDEIVAKKIEDSSTVTDLFSEILKFFN